MKNAPVTIEHACVVVLGDIGRSPRMQYHAKSLAESRYLVDLIGYVESKPLEDLTSSANVKIHRLNPFPELNLPSVLKYVFKSLWQALTLLVALISIHKPRFVLCQNPPAIPTLVVVYVYCLVTRSKMIVDWHNYTHSILAISSAPDGFIVRLAKAIEFHFGRKAAAGFCVTKAMQADLGDNWSVRATVLYDRPPVQFHPIPLEEKHALLMRLCNTIGEFMPDSFDAFKDTGVQEVTAFTMRTADGEVKYRPNRPAMLLSSTSWTPDEDFSMLVSALDIYEKKSLKEPQHYPWLICIITGKGPLKEHYKNVIQRKQWQKVSVVTPWLENEDYPKLLACADLGVCLHYSSSGLDLPMKVVDMFGSGLPVCAMRFNCIEELVQHGKNGFLFDNYQELSEQIGEWLYDFPTNIALTNQREVINQNLKEFQQLRWTENWKRTVQPVLESL
ncbi:chitobiosyldiphosphodolichol beta-mannosyltransferase [Culex pipiens pallens]|uniref:chitobiosyldiphosphodolichol beta-mannosyltransferase n=1 Tax=Culex pipiens pallens TaxID=42434 RepID=UPI0019542FA0|nr:chitobiosyldiphosphodolichol beta-mannosyltransferase [Culex pipiens pallens]